MFQINLSESSRYHIKQLLHFFYSNTLSINLHLHLPSLIILQQSHFNIRIAFLISMARDDHLKQGAEVKAYESFLAGSISGAVARAVTAPLDTVKIRLQLQTAKGKQYNGIVYTAQNIIKNEGITSLWKGNVPAEIMYILYGSVQFSTYSVLNNALSNIQDNHSQLAISRPLHSLVVGAGAGVCSTVVTYPFDLLRTRLAANTSKQFLSMMATIQSIKKTDGYRGFFLGALPAVLSVASTTGLMFWNYEMARELAREYNYIPFIEGICGFIAGASAKGMTFPLDTIRKRVQMKRYETKLGSGIMRMMFSILRNEGIFGFYRGFGISVMKTAPTSAVSLFVYEYSLNLIK